jgi:hypothetical protein
MDNNPVVARLVGQTVAEVERDLIIHTLSRHCGSRTRAAGVLGLSVRTLRNKIREYTALGIEVPAPGRTESRLRPSDLVPPCAGRPGPDVSVPTFWPAEG